MTGRRQWLLVHSWIGLTAGFVFAIVGLTGSLLVFDHRLDELLNPNVLLSQGEGSSCSLDVVWDHAQRSSPELGQPRFILAPRHEQGVYSVAYTTEDEAGQTRYWSVLVDRVTGDVLGRREWGHTLMTFLYEFHYSLAMGLAGEHVVGVCGILLIVSLVSGLWLWWPIVKVRGLRYALAIKRTRLTYDLHRTVGVVAAPVLLAVAFSGVYLVYPALIKGPVSIVSHPTPHPRVHSRFVEGAERIPLQVGLSKAQEVFPTARLSSVDLTKTAVDPIEYWMLLPDELRQTHGLNVVYVDQFSGEVLATRKWEEFNFADTFYAWQFPLHNGEAFGIVGRWVVFVSGLTPGVLLFTGVILWRRKSRIVRPHAK